MFSKSTMMKSFVASTLLAMMAHANDIQLSAEQKMLLPRLNNFLDEQTNNEAVVITSDEIMNAFPACRLTSTEKPCLDLNTNQAVAAVKKSNQVADQRIEYSTCEKDTHVCCPGNELCQAASQVCQVNSEGITAAQNQEAEAFFKENPEVLQASQALFGSLKKHAKPEFQNQMEAEVHHDTKEEGDDVCTDKCNNFVQGSNVPQGSSDTSRCPASKCSCKTKPASKVSVGSTHVCSGNDFPVHVETQSDSDMCPKEKPSCNNASKCKNYEKPKEKEASTPAADDKDNKNNKDTTTEKKDQDTDKEAQQTQTAPKPTEEEKSSNTTTIVIIVIVVIAVIALAVAGFFLWKKNKQRDNTPSGDDEEYSLLS